MSLLRSIASDFVEKRLWPVAVLLGGGLLAVLAYVAMSGGGGSAPTPVAAPPATPAGASVSAAPANPNEAVAETTFGARYQRQTGAHDPFVPLGSGTTASTTAASATTAASTTTATGGPASGTPKTGAASGSGSSAAGGAATPAPATPVPVTLTPPSTAPTKPGSTGGSSPKPGPAPTTSTHPVNVRFGTVPTASTPSGVVQQGPPVLTSHPDLKRLSPLPDAKNPIVVYMGVRPDGQTATFTLMHEAILSGDGTCHPSAVNCTLLDLRPGQKETLDYVTPSLSVVRYELDLVAVNTAKVAQAAAARFFHTESPAGRKLLKADFPPAVGTLTYDYRSGALRTTAVAAAAAARAARATPVSATDAKGSPAYAPPLPHAGPPVVQPGWLGALLHAL